MNSTQLLRFKSGLLCVSLLVASTVSLAQEYPQRPIIMAIPFGAGGSHDMNARIFTRVIPKYLDQPVIVKMMPGAAGQKGTSAVINAKADGYTLLFTDNYRDQLQKYIEYLPYDASEELVTVARVNYSPVCILVPADSPYHSLQELLNYAKSNPGMLSVAHSGNWGAQFVPLLRILLDAEAHMTFIPYKGGGPAKQALLAGDVDVGIAFPSVALPLVEAGIMRMLASAGDERLLANVPTLSELGFDDDLGLMQRVIMAPRNTPIEYIEILRSAFRKVNADEEYQRLMEQIGANTEYLDGEEYEQLRQLQSQRFEILVNNMSAENNSEE
ncbi:MAG: tripartite tricarboxylate transporter substrate binding protein [Proteobacteria bacterium]|jgi:tripartite-type tricarboxylate transporter receptor subunit TctC|nr:tripartite tricarboxylate transporter substrate binding protein [Pseudomonadota bacterium]